jgi:hypothetical protein
VDPGSGVIGHEAHDLAVPRLPEDFIAAADDLHIAPFREDHETCGTLTWIWSVVVDGVLYVRAYHGTDSSWYQAAMR